MHCTITDFDSKCWYFVTTRIVLWFYLVRLGLPLTLKWGTLEPIEDYHYENVPILKGFCACISWFFYLFFFLRFQKTVLENCSPPHTMRSCDAWQWKEASLQVLLQLERLKCVQWKRDGAAWCHWKWLRMTRFLTCHCSAGLPSFLHRCGFF